MSAYQWFESPRSGVGDIEPELREQSLYLGRVAKVGVDTRCVTQHGIVTLTPELGSVACVEGPRADERADQGLADASVERQTTTL